MTANSWIETPNFCSSNQKPVLSHDEGSSIENLSWLGIWVIAFLFLVAVPVAHAQQPIKLPTIGFLGSGASSRPWHESFKREFRKLGYVDGKNVAFIHRFADTKYDRLPSWLLSWSVSRST